MKAFYYITLFLLMVMFLSVAPYLPEFGDHHSPASMGVSKSYIEAGYPETHTQNIVTIMIADYRGFDTLQETLVVFAAGFACLFILFEKKEKE